MSDRRTRRWQPVISGTVALLLISLLAAAAVVARPVAVSAQSSSLQTAALAPSTAAMYLSVGLDQSSAQYQKAVTIFNRLGVSDPLQTAVEEATKQTGANASTDVKPFLGGELGVVITNFAAIEGAASSVGASSVGSLTGGLAEATPAAALGQIESASGVAVIIKPGDLDAAWTETQQLLQKAASDNGTTVGETTYGGVTISTVAANSADSSSSGAAAAKVNDFIILSSTAADLQPIIDTSSGKIKPVTSLADFTKVQQALPTDYLMFGFVNGQEIATGSEAGSVSSLTSMLGPAASSYNTTSGFVALANDNGFQIDSVSIPGPGSTSTPRANFNPQLPAKVPGDTALFIDGSNLGQNPVLTALLLAAAQGISGETPGGTPAAGMTAEQEENQVFAQSAQMLGFNLKTDFLDQLQGEYGIAFSVKSLSPDGIGALIVSDTADATKLNDVLTKLSALIAAGTQGSVTISTKTVNGATINVASGNYSGTPLQVEYGVVNKQMVIGFGNSLEQYAAGETSNLAANAQYQQVMAQLPKDHSSIFYLDVKGLGAILQPLISSQIMTSGMLIGTPSSSATPAISTASGVNATQVMNAIEAIAAVGYEKDGMSASSMLIYIPSK